MAVDHDPVILQQQGHRTVGRAMARGGDIGASAALIEVAAERLDDVSQGHGFAPWVSALERAPDQPLTPSFGRHKPNYSLLQRSNGRAAHSSVVQAF
jgi:hypothetical protein